MSTHALYLDRIEGEVAILLWGDREVRLPQALLPEGAREGQVWQVALTIDAELTRDAEARHGARRSRASADDEGGDLEL